jgi:hypothetical protein
MRVKSHLTSVDVRKQYTLCFVISISGTEVDSCNELVMNGQTILLKRFEKYIFIHICVHFYPQERFKP